MDKTASNYKKLTVAQLKDELVGRGLAATGKKAELIARLSEHDVQKEADEEAKLQDTKDVEEDMAEEDEPTENGGNDDLEKEVDGKESDTEIDEEKMEEGDPAEDQSELEDEDEEDYIGHIPLGTHIGGEDDEQEEENNEEEEENNEDDGENNVEEDETIVEEEENIEIEEESNEVDQENNEVDEENNEEEEEKIEGEEENDEEDAEEEDEEGADASMGDPEDIEEENLDEQVKVEQIEDEQQDEDNDSQMKDDNADKIEVKNEEQVDENKEIKVETKVDTEEMEKSELKSENEEEEDDEEGVVIDTVGEVDDEEFGQAVERLDDSTKRSPKSASTDEKDETKKEKEEKAPLAPVTMESWFNRRLGESKRFCTLYIHNLKKAETLNVIMLDWISKASYYFITCGKGGVGAAVMSFTTEEDAKAAKVALSSEFGDGVKTEFIKAAQVKDIIRDLPCPQSSQMTASRTLVIQGVTEDIGLEQVHAHFPTAQILTRIHHEGADYSWKQMDMHELPEGYKEFVLVELSSSRDLESLLGKEGSTDLTVGDHTIVAQSFEKFHSNYSAKFREIMKIFREKEKAKMDEENKKSVFNDKERLAMCRKLREITRERNDCQRGNVHQNLSWHERLNKQQQLSKQIMDLVRALDQDTDKRDSLKMDYPEPEDLMTKYTKRVYNLDKNRKRKTSKREDNKKESTKGKADGEKRTGDKIVIDLVDDENKPKKEQEKKSSDDSAANKENRGKVKVKRQPLDDGDHVDMELDYEEDFEDEQETKKETKSKKSQTPEKKKEEKEKGKENQKKDDKSVKKDDNKSSSKKVDNKSYNKKNDRRDRSRENVRVRKSRSRSRGKVTRSRGGSPRRRSPPRRRPSLSPTPERNITDKRKMDDEIDKLVMDLRQWYSLSFTKPNPYYTDKDAKKIFSKYGEIKEVHVAGKNVFIRYGNRGEILDAITHQYGKLNVFVPKVSEKYIHPKEKIRLKNKEMEKRRKSPSSSEARSGRPSRFEDITPLDKAQGMAAPGSLQTQPQQQQLQQRQQQIMLQQEMLLRQQQQSAMQAMQQQQMQQGMPGMQPGMQQQPGMQPGMQQQLGMQLGMQQGMQQQGIQQLNMPALGMQQQPGMQQQQGMQQFGMPAPGMQQQHAGMQLPGMQQQGMQQQGLGILGPIPSQQPMNAAMQQQQQMQNKVPSLLDSVNRNNDRSSNRGGQMRRSRDTTPPRNNRRDERRESRGSRRSRSSSPPHSAQKRYNSATSRDLESPPKRMRHDDRRDSGRSSARSGGGGDFGTSAEKPDEARTVAAVLKGLSKVISSKMVEMTELGGIDSPDFQNRLYEEIRGDISGATPRDLQSMASRDVTSPRDLNQAASRGLPAANLQARHAQLQRQYNEPTAASSSLRSQLPTSRPFEYAAKSSGITDMNRRSFEEDNLRLMRERENEAMRAAYDQQQSKPVDRLLAAQERMQSYAMKRRAALENQLHQSSSSASQQQQNTSSRPIYSVFKPPGVPTGVPPVGGGGVTSLSSAGVGGGGYGRASDYAAGSGGGYLSSGLLSPQGISAASAQAARERQQQQQQSYNPYGRR